MYYLFCTHYTYFICFIAVILNTLYAFNVLCLVALHLFVWKMAQMSLCYQFICKPTLNKASCILYLVSCILYLVSCIVYRVSCILYLVSCILYLVSCILDLVSCILYLVSCILYLVSCILYLEMTETMSKSVVSVFVLASLTCFLRLQRDPVMNAVLF